MFREAGQRAVAAQRRELDYALAAEPLDSARDDRVVDAFLAGHACVGPPLRPEVVDLAKRYPGHVVAR